MPAHTLHLPACLRDGDDKTAVRLLSTYFEGRTTQGVPGTFIGAQWDGFDPSGTRDSHPDHFTADDIASAALLSTPLQGRAVVELLSDGGGRFSAQLKQIDQGRAFIDLVDRPEEMDLLLGIYEELKTVSGVGRTRASKLLARKRPHAFPVVDKVLRDTVFREYRRDGHAARHALLKAFAADDRLLWDRLKSWHETAKLPADVSILRVFDVVAWMDAKGYTAA